MASSLDLRPLRAFLTVLNEGSVSRAAEVLHVTQPAISLQLKRLSEGLGLQLLRRGSHGMEPTREGLLLARKAEQVLAALGDFDQTARQLGGAVRGRLRIGTVIDPEFTRLGAFLKALVGTGSEIEVELRHGMSGAVPEGLRRDRLDIGFFLGDIRDFEPEEPGAAAAFHLHPLAPLTYRVVAPAGFGPLLRDRGWAELAALPWVGTPFGSVHHRLLRRVFGALDLRQNTVASVDQESTMLAMVRNGIGLSLCRESIALHEQQANGLVLANTVRVETELSLLCLAARRQEPLISLAFDRARSLWEGGGAVE